jgi:RNA polymerase sigma factor (sigma-70 family)
LERLVSDYLPLVYNIVGRALPVAADVDDVVQETMLRVVRGLGGLRDPERFRSWLVAVAMNQVREHSRSRGGAPWPLEEAEQLADPGADFVDLTLTELGLSGQRREVALATRWLDADDRHLLSLWWLVTAGHLTRADLVAALEIDAHHVTVRVARMKGQLDVARMVVRALMAAPRCPGLAYTAAQWRGEESPLWRKRFARHVRECAQCSDIATDLVPAERLLAGLSLVPLPAGYAAYMLAAAHAGHAGGAATTTITTTNANAAANANTSAFTSPSNRIPEQHAAKRGASHRPASHGGRGSHGASAGHAGYLASKPLLAAIAIVAAGGIGIAAKYAIDSGKPSTSAPPNSIVASGSAVGTPAGVSASANPSPTSPPTQTPALSAKPSASAAPATTQPAGPGTTADAPSQAAAVQQVFALINQARVQAGLPAYTITSGLTKSATAHNQTMAGGCGLSHQCPGEPGLGARETAAGVQWNSAGENIGEGGPVDDNPTAIAQMAESLTQSMLNEQPPNDGHRKNLLSRSFHHIGIALVRDSSGTVWMTQDFSN